MALGIILRVHANEAGERFVRSSWGCRRSWGRICSGQRRKWDDQPLAIAAVRLEMRQRNLCVDVPAGGGAGLGTYGDSRQAATAYVYDYQRLFAASDKPLGWGSGGRC